MTLEPVERGILANQFLAVLPDRQRDMVAKYYGFSGGAYTFAAIAEEYRLSTTRVQQLVTSGVRKMRRLLPPRSRPKEEPAPSYAWSPPVRREVDAEPWPRRPALLEHNTKEARARWTGVFPTDPWTGHAVETPEAWARILTDHDCKLA